MKTYATKGNEREVIPMDYKDFTEFTDTLKEYLQAEKNYIPNIVRLRDVSNAIDVAREMYTEHEIALSKDPLQMGTLFLEITGTDISAIGEREIELFNALTSKADNFEIVPYKDDEVRLSICFAGAFEVTLK